jgi:hypothetical protein
MAATTGGRQVKPTRFSVALLIGGLATSVLTSAAVAQNPAPPRMSSDPYTALSTPTPADAPLEVRGTPLPTMLSKMLMPFDPPKIRPGEQVIAAASVPSAIAVPDDLLELASIFRATATGFSSTPSTFHSATEVRSVVKSGATYQSEQLQQAMVAYGALIALREPNFVASVRAYVADPARRNTLAEYMAINPASLDVPNMDRAAGMVITALDRLGAQVAARGYEVKQAAYDSQLSSWSLVKVSDSSSRLEMTKQMSSQRLSGQAEDMSQLRRLATGEEPDVSIEAAPVAGPYKPVVAQALALAAMIVAGQAGPEHADAVKTLLTDNDADACLAQAKTTMYECYSVAGPHYEDIFCSGQHALIDTGMCMIKAAGASQTAFIEPAHRPARKVDGGSVVQAKGSPKGPKKKPVTVATR